MYGHAFLLAGPLCHDKPAIIKSDITGDLLCATCAKREAVYLSRLRGLTDEQYRQAYRKGWTAAMRGTDMDRAEVRFLSSNSVRWGSGAHWAWEDGWLDAATGRDKWHLLFCIDHDNCP